MKQFSKNSGFSLLEMSMVLLIVSIMIGSGLLVFNKYSAQSKVSDTDEKIKQIMSAIKQYAIKYNRLPCPANPSLPYGNANFGFELKASATDCTMDSGASTISRGMVPVATLGLYPSMGVDGWERRLKYVVLKDKIAVNALTSDTGSYLNVYNYGGTAYSHVIVLVLSHGENGYGSYGGRGGAISTSTGAGTNETSNISGTSFYAYPPYDGFDDILSFWTYDQIKNADLMK